MRFTLPLALLLAPLTSVAQVVINEVDYDQIGTDNAEYIEIKNVGESAFPLQYLSVVFINGNNGGAVEYRTIQSASWPALDPGDYFVICGNQGLTINCDHAATPATNLIQNGSPDAIVLMSSLDSTVYDVLSYGGDVPGYTEGTGTSAEDTNLQDGLSLSRWPDGSDTDDNDADFVIGCPTPGEANELDPVDCALSTGVSAIALEEVLAVVADPDGRWIDLYFQQASAVPLSVSLVAANGALLAHQDLGTTAMARQRFAMPDRSQLVLVRVQAGDQWITRHVVMP